MFQKGPFLIIYTRRMNSLMTSQNASAGQDETTLHKPVSIAHSSFQSACVKNYLSNVSEEADFDCLYWVSNLSDDIKECKFTTWWKTSELNIRCQCPWSRSCNWQFLWWKKPECWTNDFHPYISYGRKILSFWIFFECCQHLIWVNSQTRRPATTGIFAPSDFVKDAFQKVESVFFFQNTLIFHHILYFLQI